MKYDKTDHEWLRLFAVFEPTVDKTQFCTCRCHSVVHLGAGEPQSVEGRLGILASPEDYVTACPACCVAHHRAMKRKGAA